MSKKVTLNSNKVNGASHLPSGWRYHNCGFLCPQLEAINGPQLLSY